MSPFLDFLYPPKSRSVAISWAVRVRNDLLQRRRRLVPDLTRSYASDASNSDATFDQSARSQKPTKSIPDDIGEASRQKEIELRALLDAADPLDHDKVWDLWMDVREVPQLRSSLLEYLATSERALDFTRTRRIFDDLPTDQRSAKDYLHGTISFLKAGLLKDAKRVCAEAMNRKLGTQAWAVSLASFVDKMEWDDVLDLWDIRPADMGHNLDHEALLQVKSLPELPHRALSLSEYLRKRQESSRNSRASGLPSLLLDIIFTSADMMRNITTEMILLLTQEHKKLGSLQVKHYYNAIATLRSLEVRSNVIRSVVVYRNFRWHFNSETPSQKLLYSLLETLASLEITNGVQYILDEFILFYGKPSVHAYKLALIAFSRTGDATNTLGVYDRLVAEYGEQRTTKAGHIYLAPRTLRWITPLLHAHARVGNVRETLKNFSKISDLGYRPNYVCWNILISAYAHANDIDGAFKTFEQMTAAKIPPDSYTFGTLMGLCANNGDVEAVRLIFTVARERQVPITIAMVDPIVEAYCRNNKLDEAEILAEASLGMDLTGSRTRMWNVLLWNHAFRGDVDVVSRIHSRMESMEIQPDGMTYAALMLCLSLIGKPDAARRVLRTLHRSRRVHATEFHYTIILYAYVKARNRDMIYIIYREIEERFQNPSLSARLLMLKKHLDRDAQLTFDSDSQEDKDIHLAMSEEFLIKAIAEFDIRQFATKQPRPGTSSRPLQETFPALYYEYLITAYGADGAYSKVEEIFDDYMQRGRYALSTEQQADPPPLRLISALMFAYLRARQYAKVEDCWETALSRAVQLAYRPDIESTMLSARPDVAGQQHSPPLPQAAQDPQSLLVTEKTNSSDKSTSVHSSKRFILSQCFSLYLQALGYNNQVSAFPDVVSEFQGKGFSLTTHNWTTYIRGLAGSESASDQIEAFVTFEKKFIPNFPGWKYLRRSTILKPEGAPNTYYLEHPKRGKYRDTLGKAGKKLWSKIDPSYPQPTYVLMIYLASALLDFRERSIVDGGEQLKALYSLAPQTIRAIGEMPHLREKFQGVLLRRQIEHGDRDLEPYEPFVWTGGILGVGGEQRTVNDPEQDDPPLEEPPTSDTDTPMADQDDGHVEDVIVSDADSISKESRHDLTDTPPQTLDYQDEQDIEAETVLESRRRRLGLDPLSEDEPPQDAIPASPPQSDDLPLNLLDPFSSRRAQAYSPRDQDSDRFNQNPKSLNDDETENDSHSHE